MDTHLHHEEQHLKSSDLLTDVVIGMSDGLTVPFALAAGLSGAVSSTGIIVIAGIAEICAGSIAMGLGGYLAAKRNRIIIPLRSSGNIMRSIIYETGK